MPPETARIMAHATGGHQTFVHRAACRAIRTSNPQMSMLIPHSAPNVHHFAVPHWLVHLGIPGLFLVAVIDASIIPLPLPGSTDLFLLWLVSHKGNPWLLVACAVVGSTVGGYTTWQIGKKGGQAALSRSVPARMLAHITGWVEHHPVLSVFLPAMLPPPIPLSPFVLASGALGVARNRFLAAFGAARLLRYALIAWIAVAYGRRVVGLWSTSLQKWSAPLLGVFLFLLVSGLCFGIWKLRNLHRSGAAAGPGLQPAAD